MPAADAAVPQCKCPSPEICLGHDNCSQAHAFQQHMKLVHQKDWG